MITGQEILKGYNFRYACRNYKKGSIIPETDFNTILESGRLSPSSNGIEPWKFIVLQNPEIREKIKPFAWGAVKGLAGASHFVIALARKKLDLSPDSDYIKYILKDVKSYPQEAFDASVDKMKSFFDEDFQIGSNERYLFDWACKQTYIALGNMLTTAALLGIDSCPIEGFNREKTEQLLEEENLLDRSHFGVSVMMTFGYRDEVPMFAKTRQSQDKIVNWVL